MEAENHIYLASDEEILFDPNYRYKIIKPEFENTTKKGKPLTLLTNFELFCQAIVCEPEILLKAISLNLSCESGTVKEIGTYYLKGNYDSSIITEIICNFIKKYTLCKECDKPEVDLSATKTEIKQTCRGCGNEQNVEYDNKIYEILLKKLNNKKLNKKDKNNKKNKKDKNNLDNSDDNIKEEEENNNDIENKDITSEEKK